MATAAKRSCVLGVDLGTSALKIVAISGDGRVVATARESYPTISIVEGQAEQDCQHWLEALSAASRKVTARLPRNIKVEAVALAGQMPTLVVLGENKPIAPAITWQDSRADQWVSQRIDHRCRRDIYSKTGIRIDGRYLAPMFRFHRKAKHYAANIILSAKDFLFYVLTGLVMTDPSTASGYALYNLRTKEWDSELCRFWGIRTEQLPTIGGSSFCASLLDRGSRLLGCVSGIPVMLGCADSVAGVYALGGTGNLGRRVTVLTGTSTVIMKCDERPQWDHRSRHLLTPFAVDGWYGREADLLAAGSAREWATRALHGSAKNTTSSLWQSAYRVAPGADGLLFAPYLAGGEQGVLWNPDLRGTLIGLTVAHDAAKIARALIEGMCFEIRRCLEVLEEGSHRPSHIHLAGWMAEIPQESQLLADITGRSVRTFALSSPSAVGAALISGIINDEEFFRRVKVLVLTPSQQSPRYNQIYRKYIARFPAAR
jgi:xylulokinase